MSSCQVSTELLDYFESMCNDKNFTQSKELQPKRQDALDTPRPMGAARIADLNRVLQWQTVIPARPDLVAQVAVCRDYFENTILMIDQVAPAPRLYYK
eukprot:4800491-Lingulodinium_polyedra.AAC.1